jgi:hypothetical protein
MISFICILVGIFIVLDALYLAANADKEHRLCTLSKYAGAMMAGLYLILDTGDDVRLLLGLTVALFMWPDTYYRILDYLQHHQPKWYLIFLMHFNIKPRRKTDYETHH